MTDIFDLFGDPEEVAEPDPRKHAAATYGRVSASTEKDWGTPLEMADSVRRVLGGTVHLDPCSNQWSVVGALHRYQLPERDGLEWSWDFPTIYVNPPYGRNKERGTSIHDWLRRCRRAHEDHGSEVVALVPVATNTSHWKEQVWPSASAVCFTAAPRFKFLLEGDMCSKGAPLAIAAIYWGRNPDLFQEEFDPRWGKVLRVA